MENRAHQHRKARVADALRDEIGAILEGELADPRVGLVTVGRVLLAGKSAQVFINVEGVEDDPQETLAGLNAARAFIRHQVKERLGLRQAPELFFFVDHSARDESRVSQLLKRIEKRR